MDRSVYMICLYIRHLKQWQQIHISSCYCCLIIFKSVKVILSIAHKWPEVYMCHINPWEFIYSTNIECLPFVRHFSRSYRWHVSKTEISALVKLHILVNPLKSMNILLRKVHTKHCRQCQEFMVTWKSVC